MRTAGVLTACDRTQIELRHGQAFLVDVRSTNGTLLNGIRIDSAVPFRLREGDVVTFGSTELKVSILETVDENQAQNS